MPKKNLASNQCLINNPEQESLLHQTPAPKESDLPERMRAHSLIRISLGWYERHDVTFIEWEETALNYRKKLFNLLKNTFIKPAFVLVNQKHPDWENQCYNLAVDLLKYLQFIESHKEWDVYLPPVMCNQLCQIVCHGDWYSEQGLIAIRDGIHQALRIPPRKKTV